jgi:hypothetical protein
VPLELHCGISTNECSCLNLLNSGRYCIARVRHGKIFVTTGYFRILTGFLDLYCSVNQYCAVGYLQYRNSFLDIQSYRSKSRAPLIEILSSCVILRSDQLAPKDLTSIAGASRNKGSCVTSTIFGVEKMPAERNVPLLFPGGISEEMQSIFSELVIFLLFTSLIG